MVHSFQWIQAAIGIIVGLGMTRLIISVTNVYIGRRSIRLDWIPFVWALNIFFLLLQFSWVFVELDQYIKQWTFGLFLTMLGFVLMLFIASALVLPNTEAQAGSSLQTWFEQDGRYALLFLAAYALLAYPVNWYFAGETPDSNSASALLVTMSLVAFFTKSRKLLASMAIMNLLLTAAIVLGMVVTG